jgi:hypothetical protein
VAGSAPVSRGQSRSGGGGGDANRVSGRRTRCGRRHRRTQLDQRKRDFFFCSRKVYLG